MKASSSIGKKRSAKSLELGAKKSKIGEDAPIRKLNQDMIDQMQELGP